MGFWIAVMLAFVVLIICVVSMVVVWRLMHPKRKPVIASLELAQVDYSEISFRSRDQKVELKGWFLPAASPPKMTIIFAHGYRKNRLYSTATLPLAIELVQHGFNAVLFDFRNCGDSEGNLSTIGLDEQQDILGAIDWCKTHHNGSIGLIGYSMGAATCLLAAAKSPDVSGIIADSPFSDLNRYLLDNLSVWSKLPKYPFSPLMVFAIRYVMRKNPQLVKPILALKEIYPRPVLFIHGDQDDTIPCSESEKMFHCFNDVFQFWKVSGAVHTGSYHLYPQEYTQRVISFFDDLTQVEKSHYES